MTETEINTTIAEACGWSRHDGIYWRDPTGYYRPTYSWPDYISGTVPPFCHDLNAMAQAERSPAITSRGVIVYVTCLMNVIRKANDPDRLLTTNDILVGSIFATARQRAEAFLRTIGKWRG